MTVRLARPDDLGPLPEVEVDRLIARATRVLELLGHADAELSLVLVEDAEMAELNATWRGRKGPTDVLSFSLLEGEHAERRGVLLGDVAIGLGVAERQAREIGHSMPDELLRLLIHGVLHLLGHDHEQPEEARVMQTEEDRVLRAVLA